MTTHELKTWPVFFQRVWEGAKTFEVRLNDRGYQQGDTVILREFDVKAGCTCDAGNSHRHAAACAMYSGRTVTARIGFVLGNLPGRGSTRGFNAGEYVVFSLVDPANEDGRANPALKSGGMVAPGGPIVVMNIADAGVVAKDAIARMAAAPKGAQR